MRTHRIAPHRLVLVIILGSCFSVRSGEVQTVVPLSPAQLREDIDFLFLQLETVHPNVRVNCPDERYAKIQKWLREQCTRPLTLQEFYQKATTAVDSLDEGHTYIHPPLGRTPEEQRTLFRAQLDEMLAAKGDNPNSYALLQDRQACVLRYNSCGLPRDRARYEALFAEMFAAMKKNNIPGLVIDLRRNGGGSSSNSDLLLRYFARAPFRQYERMAKRLTPQVLTFCRSVGVDYLSYLHQAYDTSCLTLDPNGVPTQRDFTVAARFVEPVAESQRFAGPVYVLIGRGTYSSAALFASTVQYYGRAVLIGEETLPFVRGNKHYGDVVFVYLPHSQLTVQVSTAVFTVMRADKERSARIVPDHKVLQQSSDTDKRIDTAETFALDLLEKQLQK